MQCFVNCDILKGKYGASDVQRFSFVLRFYGFILNTLESSAK